MRGVRDSRDLSRRRSRFAWRFPCSPCPPRAGRAGSRSSVLAVLIAVVLAACAGGATQAPTIPPDATSSVAPAATGTPLASAPASEAAAFPLTLTDDEGTAVEIAEEPDTIVSLTPAATETLFALGVGDRIVGKGSDFFLYPPAASAIPDVQSFDGTELKVDVEQIVALEPDVVFAGGNFGTPPADIERLRSLDIPVVVVYAPTIEKVLDDIELLGDAVGRRRGGRRDRRGDAGRASTRSRRRSRPAPAAGLLRARRDGRVLRPGRQLVPRRDDRAGRRRAGHDRIGRPLRHPRRAAHRPRTRRSSCWPTRSSA